MAHVGPAKSSVVKDGTRRVYISSRSSRGSLKNKHGRCGLREMATELDAVRASWTSKRVIYEKVGIGWTYL